MPAITHHSSVLYLLLKVGAYVFLLVLQPIINRMNVAHSINASAFHPLQRMASIPDVRSWHPFYPLGQKHVLFSGLLHISPNLCRHRLEV